MNKLKHQVFYTLFTILTLFILSFCVLFNIQKYLEQHSLIERSLQAALPNGNGQMPPLNGENDPQTFNQEDLNSIKYMDATIYTVLLDENQNIKDIINHSSTTMDNEQIQEKAMAILSQSTVEPKHIGILYFDNYSYQYEQNSLILLDQTQNQKVLWLSLGQTLFLFTLFEIILFYVVIKITHWICAPVEESFEKQKQFISDASHELKTPLSVIIASSELLEENPQEIKWLKNIQSEANRMNDLVHDLLELSASEKIEALHFQVGSLSKVIELSVLTFEGKAFEKQREMQYDIEKNIEMNFDENKIRQLVEILLDNALSHSYKESTITISLKQSKKEILFSVSNQGDTIDKEQLEHLFERFYRVDTARSRKENHYGLGLAIAKNIVESHQGTIQVQSENHTTTFQVLFKNQ